MIRNDQVGDVREHKLLLWVGQYLTWQDEKAGFIGVGDDSALLPPQASNLRTVVSTDLLLENTHFRWSSRTDWEGVGRKAAGANISDIAAMGAKPLSMFVSIGMPSWFLIKNLEALYRGIFSVASAFGAPIVGGDTSRSDRVCISITITGTKDTSWADCLRTDARAGDYLYVTGELGGSRVGLEALLEPVFQDHMDLTTASQGGINRHYGPTPRVETGLALAKLFPRVSMIDISDSLYNEAFLLSRASGVELELHIDRIPVHPAATEWCSVMGIDPEEFALFSGEEYELLFAVPVPPGELHNKLREAGVDCPVAHVGTVKPGSGFKLLQGGRPVNPNDETFAHFT